MAKAIERLRARTIARIQRRLTWPRLQMMLVVLLTGATGFLSSFALLRAGVERLPVRYLVAVGIAYAAFLTLLWIWLRLGQSRLSDIADVPDLGTADLKVGGGVDRASWTGGGRSGGGGATGVLDDSPAIASLNPRAGPAATAGGRSHVLSAGSLADSDEALAVVVALVAVVGATIAALWIVWAAPALFAELSLDAAVSTGLYRRLRRVSGDHWLTTAIRRTGLPFLAVAVLFAIAGAAIQYYVPDARSMVDLLRGRLS
jgi:hypothetical protein